VTISSREHDRGRAGAGQTWGTLIALWAADADSIDPGITYSQSGTQIVRATQKTLYEPKGDDPTVTEPDVATRRPELAGDGCWVTVTLKRGVRFRSPNGSSFDPAGARE
jgi:ABC-type transport system substrate-binding protein